MNLMTFPTAEAGRQLKEDLGQQIEVDEAVLSREFLPFPRAHEDRLTSSGHAGLPAGTQILSASRHGSDRWARSAKLVAKLPDGSVRPYLLRVTCSRHPPFFSQQSLIPKQGLCR
jgi:hypothetical protein